jgi:hypothetical protein
LPTISACLSFVWKIICILTKLFFIWRFYTADRKNVVMQLLP